MRKTVIAELFYPKELKDVIADLRAKGDLNEAALKRLEYYVFYTLGCYFFTCALFLIVPLITKVSLFYWLLILSLFSILFFGFRHTIQKMSSKTLMLYNYGILVPGECVFYACGGGYHYPRKYRIEVKFKINNEEKASEDRGNNFPVTAVKFKKGDPVFVAYDPQNPDINVPFFQSFSDVFYLRKGSPYDHFDSVL